MARKPNYAFERNERAKLKAKKREAKRQAKLDAKADNGAEPAADEQMIEPQEVRPEAGS